MKGRGDTLYVFEGAVAPAMLNYVPSMLMLHPQCVILKSYTADEFDILFWVKWVKPSTVAPQAY